MRFCLILGWVGLAGIAAAETPGAQPAPARIVSIVRSESKTGRLVRATSVSNTKRTADAWKATAEAVDRYVQQTAERYKVDPLLVRSVIQAESGYNPAAVSTKGAQGLMQLMPATARRFAVRNTFSPVENIDGGVRYLSYLLTLFGDQPASERLALAAYNAGEGAVFRHRGVPPYKETTAYVDSILRGVEAKRAAQAKTSVPLRPRVVQYVDSAGILHVETRYEP